MSLLNQDQVDAFRRDGVLLLRGVFSDWIDILRKGVETNMCDPGPFGREYLEQGQEGRFFGDYCNWNRIDEYRSFMFDSPVVRNDPAAESIR